MSEQFEKYERCLKSAVGAREEKCGNLGAWAVKHFLLAPHKMNVEDQLFCAPALNELEKYEGWLNE